MRGFRRGLPAAVVVAVAAGVLTPGAAGATPAPPFNQCPAVGLDPSCALLIVVSDAGVTVLGDPAVSAYDGSDDTMVGILNSSTKAVGSLPLSSTSHPIFGFEDDGLCSGPFANSAGNDVPAPAGCPFGSTGYEGPGTSFNAISADTMSGIVNFTTPIPAGGSAYFSLEDTLLASDIVPGVPTTTPGGGATPTVVTQASAAVPVGGTITDTATLGGGNAPTGTITFSAFGPADPTCKATPVFSSAPVSVHGAGSYTSTAFATAAVGTYHFVANYSGDANNSAVATGCTDANEAVTTTKATPTIATQAGPAITAGGATADTATLGAGFKPTGTVNFKLYGPADPACVGPAVATWTINVNGDGTITSGAVTLGTAGRYTWTAVYSGDANNVAVASACNDPKEAVVVGTTVVAVGAACGALGGQVDGELPGQTIGTDLNQGFSFGLTTSLSMGVRVVLRAKDPTSGGFVSLANLLVHAAGPVTARAPENGLGPSYARRAQRFLAASEQAGSPLVLFRIVHCRPDKQTVSAESIAVDSLNP